MTEPEPESEPTDPLPMLRAEVDQMVMLAPELARIARAYFNAYSAEGFADNQALYLTTSQIHQNPGKAP